MRQAERLDNSRVSDSFKKNLYNSFYPYPYAFRDIQICNNFYNFFFNQKFLNGKSIFKYLEY